MKRILMLLVPLLFVGILFGCDEKAETSSVTDKNIIKVGTSPGPYSELFINAIKPILEKNGYVIKTVDFTNLRQADIALNDGDIDLNVDQHTAYYQDFNHHSNGNLVGITQIPTVPTGIYAGNKKSLNDVAKGDKIAIPQDASNMARAYSLLQKTGWITLKEGTILTKATSNDIVENKYGITILEIDSATIPRSLADLDYAIIPGSVVYSANIDISTSLLQEDILDHFILVATINAKNKDTNWVKAVVDAYHSDEFKDYLTKHNQNNYWFVPDSLK